MRKIFFIIVFLLSQTAIANTPYVVIFLVDGARSDILHRMVDEGKLPTIKRLFMDDGADVVQGITVFPTTSTNAYQSFMTGLFSGHAGIPYLARYSRSETESIEYLSLKGTKILNADLLNWYQLNDPEFPFAITQGSLFDHLAPLPTASIYATFYRNAGFQTPTFPLRAAWDTFLLGDHNKLDALSYGALTSRFRGPKDTIPRLSFVALLGTDVIAHEYGALSKEVEENFIQFDHMVADFEKLLKEKNLWDQSYVVIVGDHGNHNIEHRSYLRERLLKEGVVIRSRHMRPPYELAINARGVSCAIISVAGKGGWKSFPTIDDLHHVRTKKGANFDLLDYLRRQPETDLLLVRDGNHQVRLYGATGEAIVTRVLIGHRYFYSYRVTNGSDPLLYDRNPTLKPLLNGTALTAAQWLPLTANETYSDAIVQVAQIFTDGRVGDIIIVPKQTWVFRHEKAATHGGLSQDDMRIPILMRGPGILPQKIPFGRSVDVMPTILAWFDKSTPHRDGQDLFRPDPPPNPIQARLAEWEARYLHGSPKPLPANLRNIAQEEWQRRSARVQKLEELKSRCQQRKRMEDRLTRPDTNKRLRVSTCEVIDLALKTAYEDRERLHATHNTLQRQVSHRHRQ